jgi:succinate dehydrogenase / fumarate reductase membrane anchor subunit
MIALARNPFVALGLTLLVVNVAIHMRNGMRDVLEDYFAGQVYSLLMMLNTLFCIIIAVAGVASILKLVFWG